MTGSYLLLRPAKIEEYGVDPQVGLLSSFLNIGKQKWHESFLWKKPKYLSLEIASLNQKTRFYMKTEPELESYFSSQILSQYPKTLAAAEKNDPLYEVVKGKNTALASLNLIHDTNYPIKSYKHFTSLPPL